MLTIRNTQMKTLGQCQREQFIGDMLDHLYRYFPAVAWLLTPDELRHKVDTLIERAAQYQLTSRQEVCRFLNLAATYGWEFDSDADLLWMRSILNDTSLTRSGDRLDRLVQTCLHRQYIQEHNQALHQQLGLAPALAASTSEPERAEDYLGRQYLISVPTAASTEEIFTRNLVSYHLSQSLWNSVEIVPVHCPSEAIPLWANTSAPLLRTTTGERLGPGN
jgi:hypothetical protein